MRTSSRCCAAVQRSLARGILLVALDNGAHAHVRKQRLRLALAEGLIGQAYRRHHVGGIIAGIGVEALCREIAVQLGLGDAHVSGEFAADHGPPELTDQGRLGRGDIGGWAVPERCGARLAVFRVGGAPSGAAAPGTRHTRARAMRPPGCEGHKERRRRPRFVVVREASQAEFGRLRHGLAWSTTPRERTLQGPIVIGQTAGTGLSVAVQVQGRRSLIAHLPSSVYRESPRNGPGACPGRCAPAPRPGSVLGFDLGRSLVDVRPDALPQVGTRGLRWGL